MCTTSTECKTVITVMLTVMSGMDPHMISWNLRWAWFGLVWLVLSKWISLGCGSVTVSLYSCSRLNQMLVPNQEYQHELEDKE
jgi:hypothetical protein